MRKIIYCIFLMCWHPQTSWSQMELKINPIGLFLEQPTLSFEYLLKEQLSVELIGSLESGRTTRSLFRDPIKKFSSSIYLATKTYLRPNHGNDRMFVGLFLGPTTKIDQNLPESFSFEGNKRETSLDLGFLFGRKWVFNNQMLFEIIAGTGRKFFHKVTYDVESSPPFSTNGESPTYLIKFNLGYRFSN